MIVTKLHIKNFRSLRNVLIENIGNISVLIGANSSGKSNIMEALYLFFTELDANVSRAI